LPDDRIGQGSGLEARTNSLAEFAVKSPEFITEEGTRVGHAIVDRATSLWKKGAVTNLGPRDRDEFADAMEKEGKLIRDDGAKTLHNTFDGIRKKETTDMGSSSGARLMATPPNWALGSQSNPTRKVFIVHGHAGAEDKVARFVERLGFEAIILNEQADGGKTIVEKLESNSDVGFAVVLLTPDDEGAERGKPLQGRARQNVILEWGYFAGRLGRKSCLRIEIRRGRYSV
jgi:hypothetical protein